MLADAIRGEFLKLSRDRRSLLFSFLSVPLGYVAFRLVLLVYTRLAFRVDFGSVDIVKDIIHAFAVGQNFVAQLLFLSGSVGIVAQEYRFETWRHILPRNNRSALLLAKLAVYAVATAFCIFLVGQIALLIDGAEARLSHDPLPDLRILQDAFVPLSAAFLASLLICLTWGAFATLVCVMSRSSAGAIIFTGVLAMIEPLVAERFARGTVSSATFFIFPSIASNALTRWSLRTPEIVVSDDLAMRAIMALTLWIFVLSTAAVTVFRFQDLARE